ncbi:MAG: ATP synthase F1 subunit delta [Gemmatimonadetes bacterium]|nr:ATP synthase F1 subunit delta [Gemmatimonadota bacterium]
MREPTIARSYAEALFELGERQDQQEAFARASEELATLLEREPRLRAFLETPKVEAAAKKRVLRDALGERVPALFLNFLQVVIDKRRQRLLREIAREYRSLLDERLGRLHVQVLLAREPDERTEREIAEELSQALGRKVIAHLRVEPAILGGIVVRYRDRVLDGSLRRKLLSLRRRMVEAELPRGVHS